MIADDDTKSPAVPAVHRSLGCQFSIVPTNCIRLPCGNDPGQQISPHHTVSLV